MSRAQTTGLLLMAGAALEVLLFFIGVLKRSYLALALPVTLAMMTASALTFWLGWTMLTMDDEDEASAEPADVTV
jgi:hypothetical protein